MLKWWNKNGWLSGGVEEVWKIDDCKNSNAEDEEAELLIVVGKLLTGFDAPRCTILYIAKPLAEHNLLQAIARVNRLFEGKDFGYIYWLYRHIRWKAWSGINQLCCFEFTADDLDGTINNIAENKNYHKGIQR